MRKIKIAVWLNKNYQPDVGGGFSYYDRLVEGIDKYEFDPTLDICFVTESIGSNNVLSKPIVQLFYKPKTEKPKIRDRVIMKLPYIGKIIKRRFYQNLEKRQNQQKNEAYNIILKNSSVDIIYYICQAECALLDFPFIATNWDIGHCSTFAFPELITDRGFGFELRNNFYSQVLPRALMIFVESLTGKSEILKYTKIGEHKLRVVPIFAGNCVNIVVPDAEQKKILEKYGLEKNSFFFYPAQFWAHKNHSLLLKSFAKLSAIFPKYKLVLTGADYGNLEYIQSLAQQFNIENKVLFLGFVPINCINTFYLNTTSLIMPSYLGPTNMPPIEAMELGCPVICSDIEGHHEILGEAAIYFNPMNENELYDAMVRMINNPEVYRELITRRNEKSVFKIDYSINKMNEYFKEIAIIRSAWK